MKTETVFLIGEVALILAEHAVKNNRLDSIPVGKNLTITVTGEGEDDVIKLEVVD